MRPELGWIGSEAPGRWDAADTRWAWRWLRACAVALILGPPLVTVAMLYLANPRDETAFLDEVRQKYRDDRQVKVARDRRDAGAMVAMVGPTPSADELLVAGDRACDWLGEQGTWMLNQGPDFGIGMLDRYVAEGRERSG